MIAIGNTPAAQLKTVVRQEAWRFLQGESPRRVRPNQPPVPSVAVVEEAKKKAEQDS